uniref:hypothetical protein n=1 Tax=Salmonella enterica TaxID=28901 RepID=UPI001FAC63AF
DLASQKMTVIGMVDPVKVVSKLRKASCSASIVSIGPANPPPEKKEEKKEEKKDEKKEGEGEKKDEKKEGEGEKKDEKKD